MSELDKLKQKTDEELITIAKMYMLGLDLDEVFSPEEVDYILSRVGSLLPNSFTEMIEIEEVL